MESAVFHREQHKCYDSIVRGDGIFLEDANGRRYIDATSCAGVVSIGHGVTEISQSLADAGNNVTFVYSANFTHPWQEELASQILKLAPDSMSSAYFVSGGSEANETAWKLARQYHIERGKPSKYKAIARWQSYHGVTLGALSLSGRRSWREPYAPMLIPVPHIMPPYCYRCPVGKSPDSCQRECVDDLERTILLEGPDTVACFFAEPISGSSLSAVTPPEDYFQRVREICDRYDVLFVADEILTGIGRTGKPFAISHWEIEPDIITMGKAIASGYASLGAVLITENIRTAFREGSGHFVHGLTYSGNPFSCFMGLKVNEIMHRDGLFERPERLGRHLFGKLRDLQQKHCVIGDVRGRGLLAGIEFVRDRTTREPFPHEFGLTQQIVTNMRDQGIVITPGIAGANYGAGGDHIQICPPFVITEDQLDQIVGVLSDVLSKIEAELSSSGRSSSW